MTNTKIKNDAKNLTLDGYTGTWKVINGAYADPEYRHFVYLLENEQPGAETNYLIITQYGQVLCDHHSSIYQYGQEVLNNIEASNELAYQQMTDACPY